MAERLEDVTAAILAGGLGMRLRSRIADRPKVLALVHGRPYLTYLLDQLAGAGVRTVVLLTGYRAEQVRSTLGDNYAGLSLTYSCEPSPLGTAGAIRRALPYLSSSTILTVPFLYPISGSSIIAKSPILVSSSPLWRIVLATVEPSLDRTGESCVLRKRAKPAARVG